MHDSTLVLSSRHDTRHNQALSRQVAEVRGSAHRPMQLFRPGGGYT
jgi:hypothetical protein